MAEVTATNSTSPNTIKWATAGSNTFVRATHLAGVTENFDLHDHSSGKGLGVMRVQTGTAPSASGHVRVNADTWQWWAASAAAVRTAVDVEGSQTVSGAKTFSNAVTTFSGRATWGSNGTGAAGSVYKDSGGGLVVWGVTGSTSDITLLNNAGSGALTVPAGTQNVSLAGDLIITGGQEARIDTLSGDFQGLRLGASTDVTTSNYNLASDSAGQLLVNALSGQTINLRVNNSDSVVVAASGLVFINDTANAGMTTGLTINQGAADNEILSFKSSDVAHGVTSLTETDTFGYFDKGSPTAGGLRVFGVSEDGTPGITVSGVATTANTTKNSAADAPVRLNAALKSGTASGNVSANGNLLVVSDSTSAARFIVDVEGEVFCDGASTAMTSYDEHDDVSLVRAVELVRGGPGLIRSEWDRFVTHGRADLERLGIVGADGPDGARGLLNVTGLQRLHNGAIWQLYTRLRTAEERLAAAESRLALGGS